MILFIKCILALQFIYGTTAHDLKTTGTLKSVQILFRHGIRERDAGYGRPSGNLKPSGKKQMFDLGIYFRQRYDSLLGKNYDENEITILSSDVGRTIQCASLVAFGLYKEFNMAASWNDEEKIQFEPIPVRTIPKKYDKYIQLFPDCPRQKELEEESANAFFGRYLEENADLVEYYYNHSGDETILDSSKGRIEQFTEMMFKTDQLSMNQTSNVPIVDWAKPLTTNYAFLSLKTGFLREEVNTLEKKRLNAGSLINLLTKNMEEPLDLRKKMYLFSGHDRILIFLMGALGIDDPQVPDMRPTGAALIIELHEEAGSESGPFIEFLFRNDTRHEPYILKMPNCGSRCYLSTFKNLTANLIPTNFKEECLPRKNSHLKATNQEFRESNFIFSVAIFTISTLVLTGLSLIIILAKRRNYVRL